MEILAYKSLKYLQHQLDGTMPENNKIKWLKTEVELRELLVMKIAEPGIFWLLLYLVQLQKKCSN